MPLEVNPRLILTRGRGNPVFFSLALISRRSELRTLVTKHGGVLQDPGIRDDTGIRISLVDPGLVNQDPNKDLFDMKYVQDCVEAKMLLPNLRDYRVGESVFQDYDPFKVLRGEVTWDKIQRIPIDREEGTFYIADFYIDLLIYIHRIPQ